MLFYLGKCSTGMQIGILKCLVVEADDYMALSYCNFINKIVDVICIDLLPIVMWSCQLLKQLIFEHCLQIAENVLRLCLAEVFVFRFMQTDPNWSNFLFNSDNGRVNLCYTFVNLCFY